MLEKMRKSRLTVKISKNFLLKISLIFGSLFGVFFMTGMLYFRNDVVITDGAEKRTVVTVHADPNQILKENNINLGEYDRMTFSGFDGGKAELVIQRAFPVKVKCDGEQIATVYNIDSTVKELLEKFEIEIGEYDFVSPSLDSVVKYHDSINIERSYDVTITADEKEVTVPCYKNTVKEIIDRAGIKLEEHDKASKNFDDIITEPCNLKVYRVKIETTSEEKVTPFETITVPDNLTVIGNSRVKVEGVDGLERTTYTKTYIDGVEVSSSTVTEIVTPKVNEVIGQGAAVAEPYCKIDNPAIILENGRPVNYEYIVSGKATAYTAPAGSYTASGRKAEIGTCAVNPNQIPYGSMLYIVGQNDRICYGYAIAADTGDGMMAGTIPVDVYMGDMETHYDDSCRWGLQMVDIYVIKIGDNKYQR